MRKITLTILSILILAFGRSAVPSQQGREFQIKRHNINQVEMCISNYGKYGQDEAGNAGCWWPKNSGHNYIFGAGPWFGTIEEASGDTLVTIGYGPHGGEHEYVPGIVGMPFSSAEAIIYMAPSPWPPPIASYPMAPQESKSHQDSWCAYNDLDPVYHTPGDTRPIGLEVYQTVYAWNLSTTQDIIFIRYELKNVSGHKLVNCYFGVCCDNDIGGESGTAANDIMAGILGRWYVINGESLYVDDIGYQWQEVAEGGWTEFPGALAYDYLQSPWDLVANQDKDNDGILDQYEMDSAYFWNSLPDSMRDADQDGTPDWRDPSQIPQLGMTALKRFTIDVEPNRDNERYITLAGRNFKTGAYEPYDTIPTEPADQRFLQCSGPFDLDTNKIATVLVGVVLAYWHNIWGRPDSALVQVDNTAQFIYDKNWLLPGPPPPPQLTLIPGDTKVTLIWDSSPESKADPYYDIVSQPGPLYDPYYRKYDFEGYGVWESKTGRVGEWRVIARFDLLDGITFAADPAVNDSVALYANDVGIAHSYVAENLRNGFTYYYAVSSYDFNMVKSGDSAAVLIFESGSVGYGAAPRRDPVNYVGPGEPQFESVFGNARLLDLVQAEVTSPLEVDANRPIFVEFMNPETLTIAVVDTSDTIIHYIDGVRYALNILDVDSNIVASMLTNNLIGKSLHPDQLATVDGIAATVLNGTDSFPAAISFFDTVEITGTYPIELLGYPASTVPNPSGSPYCRGFWAYRGNDYQVTWKKTDSEGPVNTVEVLDLATNEIIPFQPFQNNDATRHLGEGWCFTYSTAFTTAWTIPGTDTLVPFATPAGQRTKSLYINGGLISLRNGTFVLDSLRPSATDVWIVRANQEYLAAPVYGLVKISATPGYFDSLQTYTLNVKVVPNPYLVSNEWQTSFRLRRLKFINLPSDCYIRIFTLNGELIKILHHQHTETLTGLTTVPNNAGGDEWWDLLSENRQLIASGVYIFHVQSDVGEQVGKFVVIR